MGSTRLAYGAASKTLSVACYAEFSASPKAIVAVPHAGLDCR